MVLVNGNASLLITVSQRLSLATQRRLPKTCKICKTAWLQTPFRASGINVTMPFFVGARRTTSCAVLFRISDACTAIWYGNCQFVFSHHPYPEAESGPRRSRNTPPEREQRSLSTTLTGCQECQTPDAKGKKKVVAFGGGQQRSPSLRSSVVEGEPAGITIP